MEKENTEVSGELVGDFQFLLLEARGAFRNLGERGRAPLLNRINQFYEQPIVADIACEEAIIAYARKAEWPVRVLSEEHGRFDLCEYPTRLLVLDGLDGSGVYQRGEEAGQYGTFLALFQGTEPKFSDWLISGAVLQKTGCFLMAVNHPEYPGVLVSDSFGIKTPASWCHVSDEKITSDSLLYADEFVPAVSRIFSRPLRAAGFEPRYLKASVGYYTDLARGKAVAVLECTRKDSLEIISAYGLIKKAGGVMIDAWSGEDLAREPVIKYGARYATPIIAANNRENAEEIRRICGLADGN